jgi:hypothetical protein
MDTNVGHSDKISTEEDFLSKTIPQKHIRMILAN